MRGRFRSGVAQVLVVGVDGRTMGMIRESIGTEAVLPTNATPYDQALGELRVTKPTVVIVGFDGDFDEAIRLGPLCRQEHAGVQLVAISETTNPERIRAAMRAGFRDFVVLPDDETLLRQAIHESAYAADDVAEDQGEVIAVLGTKGGSGVTMLTCHLAAELSALERVCVLDFNFNMGDVATQLDLQPKNSIADLFRSIDRLDERMLRGSVGVHKSKVHILAQPNELEERYEIREEEVLRLLTLTADAYQYVLVDCGNQMDQAATTAVAVADVTIVVCKPDVLGVKNTYRRLQLLTRAGVDKEAIRLVVNGFDKHAAFSLADIETNLGHPVAASIAFDQQNCDRALTEGQLLRDVAKAAQITRDIGAAAGLITDKAEKVTATESSSLFGKFFK